MSLDPSLARLLLARLCHDLSGGVATLAGTLDLVEPHDPAMLELARETARSLRLRLRLYAAAWGGTTGDLDAAGLATLLAGAPAAPRVSFALEGLFPGRAVPAAVVPLVLNAALLAAEALPHGGTVRLEGDAGRGLAVWPDGRSAAWPTGLLTALSGAITADLTESGPRRVLAPLVLVLAREAGWRVSIALGPSGGAAPLLLTPA